MYPIDILRASLGDWSTLGEMLITSSAIVTGDRSQEGLRDAVRRTGDHDALHVELNRGTYQIQLRSISFEAIKRVASVRVLASGCSHPERTGQIGMTSTRAVGELFIFDQTRLNEVFELISDYFDNFHIGTNDCDVTMAELYAEGAEAQLPFAYARAGFDGDGTVPVHELRDPTGNRVGFQLDFLTIGSERVVASGCADGDLQEIVHWITDKSMRPANNRYVLIACGLMTGVGYQEDGRWFWEDGGGIESEVAAWARLPRGPYDQIDDRVDTSLDTGPSGSGD